MTFLFFYTDPGSGMMLLQILLGFAAGALFYFRKAFYKILGKDKAAESINKEINSENSRHDKGEI